VTRAGIILPPYRTAFLADERTVVAMLVHVSRSLFTQAFMNIGYLCISKLALECSLFFSTMPFTAGVSYDRLSKGQGGPH